MRFGIKCKKKIVLAKPNNAKKVLALLVRAYLGTQSGSFIYNRATAQGHTRSWKKCAEKMSRNGQKLVEIGRTLMSSPAQVCGLPVRRLEGRRKISQ